MPLDGLLVVDKPEGPTSHDVVARMRRVLREKRIGHTGTLDPLATGVLPLVVGRATRLAQFLTSERKRYTAGIRLGQATLTGDRLGDPAGPARDAAVTMTAIEAALARFRGTFAQTPPAFSAKKVAGVASYVLARRGEAAALQPVRVTVFALELLTVQGADLEIDVTCSAGFYVRSLAHDLGEALGCGAHLIALRRTASGAITLADATPLDVLERDAATAEARLRPLSDLLPDWPSVTVTAAGADRVRHGALLGEADCTVWHGQPDEPPAGVSVRVVDEAGTLLALGAWRPPAAGAGPDGRALHPSVVLV